MDSVLRFPKRERRLTLCEAFLFDVRSKILFVMMSVLFIGLGIPYMFSIYHNESQKQKQLNGKCLLEHELRIDCLPSLPNSEKTQDECHTMGCCWEELDSTTPNCFHPHPSSFTYNVTSMKELNGTGFNLKLTPNFENASIHKATASKIVNVDIQFLTPYHLRVTFDDGLSVNAAKFLRHEFQINRSSDIDNKYDVTFPRSGRFTLTVRRKMETDKSIDLDAPAIFNTFYGPMIVSKGYAELTTLIPSFNIFGIGQNPKGTFRHDLKYAKRHVLFSSSSENHDSDKFTEFTSGVHPFYMVLEKSGDAHGVLLLSSVPLEIETRGTPSVTFRVAESRLDFHIFLGPTPADVTEQLTRFIGRPYMPPYWALGYHSCRKKVNLSRTSGWLKYTRSGRIPQDSDCIGSEILSIPPSSKSFSNLKKILTNLHSTNRKIIVFHTPHVSANVLSCNDFNHSDDKGVFVKRFSGISPFIGFTLEKGKVVYPDMFNGMESKKWYELYFKNLTTPLDFDGLVLDLNTPTKANAPENDDSECRNSTNRFPYVPAIDNITDGTVCMNALHLDNVQHFYFHNMYGQGHMKIVNDILIKYSKFSSRRLFLCSLSTFPGSGTYGCHWNGNVAPSWRSLKGSLIQMLDFSLFGIPMIATPACGTNGRLNAELCSRWLQLAAFQPLFMTYRLDDVEILHGHRMLTSVGRSVIQLRYSLLPYFYSLFRLAKTHGNTVVRPLFYEFPQVESTYGIDEQFMWGSGILVSPVLRNSTQKIKAFFPPGCWYDYYTGRMEANTDKGIYKELLSIGNHVILHIRGGHIIPSQNAQLTTAETRRQNFSLSVALSCSNKNNKLKNDHSITARGEIFIDDGESIDGIDTGKFLLVSTVMQGNILSMEPKMNNLNIGTELISVTLNKIHFYGVINKPSECFVDDVKKDVPYNSVFESLIFNDLNFDLRKNHTIYCE